jgi:hypothetical protein
MLSGLANCSVPADWNRVWALVLAPSGNDLAPTRYLHRMDHEDPYLEEDVPGFVEDGERFDRPVPNRRVQKIVRTVAALVLASMLAAAGTPISWVSVATAILMVLIWAEIGRTRPKDDDEDII